MHADTKHPAQATELLPPHLVRRRVPALDALEARFLVRVDGEEGRAAGEQRTRLADGAYGLDARVGA